jgi:hypothetical protein
MTIKRAIAFFAVGLVAAGILSGAGVAGAADEVPQPLIPGVEITGGVVNEPGSEPREMNADQALAFMQAWFAYSIYGDAKNQEPPESLPVSTIEISSTYKGEEYDFKVLYAGNEKKAWVGMPAQALWPGVFVNEEKWIRAPDRAIAGYAGTLDPVMQPAPPTTPGEGSAAPASDGDDDGIGAGAIAVVLVVLAGGVALVAFAIRKGRSRVPT